MQIEEQPDVHAFREKVSGLKDTKLFDNPKVKALLVKMLEATQ